MTFSLVGRCQRTGATGAVIASASMAVAARCAAVRAGAGAVCSQSTTDPRLRGALLDAMAGGAAAGDALAAVVARAPDIAFRQLTAVDAAGRAASYSGERALGDAADVHGPDAAAAGNLLADNRVPAAMLAAFTDRAADDLGTRLVAALQAGLAAGGEVTPVRSAGLLIAESQPWPVTDLRVDWHDDPVGELAGLWQAWQPLASDYVTRALRPSELAELCAAWRGGPRSSPAAGPASGPRAPPGWPPRARPWPWPTGAPTPPRRSPPRSPPTAGGRRPMAATSPATRTSSGWPSAAPASWAARTCWSARPGSRRPRAA
jgi:uncharacterized Ntn-hydrolase superfamily protein